MKIVLDLNTEEINTIRHQLEQCDDGPEYEGWFSKELMAMQEKFEEAVVAAQGDRS